MRWHAGSKGVVAQAVALAVAAVMLQVEARAMVSTGPWPWLGDCNFHSPLGLVMPLEAEDGT